MLTQITVAFGTMQLGRSIESQKILATKLIQLCIQLKTIALGKHPMIIFTK